VTSQSTIHPILGEVGAKEEEPHDVEMLAGVKHDLVGCPPGRTGETTTGEHG
jgi:hypothetical protein